MTTAELRTRFLEAVMWQGQWDKANSMLAAHPELARSDIHVAAGSATCTRSGTSSPPDRVDQAERHVPGSRLGPAAYRLVPS